MIRSLRLNTGKLYIDVVMRGSFGTIYGIFSAPGKFDPNTTSKSRSEVEARLRGLQAPVAHVAPPAPPAPVAPPRSPAASSARSADSTPWPSTGWDDSELVTAAPVQPSPPCCSAFTPYPNRFTEITGHHRECPTFDTPEGRARAEAVNDQIQRERNEETKVRQIKSARDQVATLESLVATHRRRLAIPRGGSNVRDHNATMALFQGELDKDLQDLEKAKARLSALLK